MTNIRKPILTPIRFYDPNLEFDNESTFQNPDNRVSSDYNFENVSSIPYALPIPKQWPDGQPGIDFLMNTGGVTVSETFYAYLYDSDDVYYKELYVQSWEPVNLGHQSRVWLDGTAGTAIADGYYTIKLFAVSDDALLLESEALYIAEWFENMIPFEFWNFENDFGMMWDNALTMFTARVMVPIRIFDPEPKFEKEMYLNDPGVLTTLRTIMQRQFSFDSLPVPVHVAEIFVMAFGCSELYLDRIKINSEDSPEAEILDGTNLKQISGKAIFVDFPNDYIAEKVETIFVDESIDWATGTYNTKVITGNSVVINDPVCTGDLYIESDSISYSDEEVILIKVVLTDDSGDDSSDLPLYVFDGAHIRLLEWGTNYISIRANATASDEFKLINLNGEKAVFTAVLTVYSIS